jgi:hypothetical protein
MESNADKGIKYIIVFRYHNHLDTSIILKDFGFE